MPQYHEYIHQSQHKISVVEVNFRPDSASSLLQFYHSSGNLKRIKGIQKGNGMEVRNIYSRKQRKRNKERKSEKYNERGNINKIGA
jgi:hypothetical protein